MGYRGYAGVTKSEVVGVIGLRVQIHTALGVRGAACEGLL